MKNIFRRTREYRVGAQSHLGKVREENQDHMSRFLSPVGEVFVVADGMGGHQGGGIAAEMVTHGFEECLAKAGPGQPIPRALQEATTRINAEIFRRAYSGDPATEKMGSTVVLAVLKGEEITIGHVGDSRAYLLRNGSLRRLTKDHSQIQKMIDSGFLSEREARDHPDASILNRNMGGREQVEIEVSEPIQLKDGDAVMLCTDGLCGYAELDTIGRILCATPDAQAAADALVRLTLDGGGEDNVTIQVIQYGQRKVAAYRPPAPIHQTSIQKPRAKSRRLIWIMAGILGAALLIGGGIFIGLINPFRWGEKGLPPLPEMNEAKKSASSADSKELGIGQSKPEKVSEGRAKDDSGKTETYKVLVRYPDAEKGLTKAGMDIVLQKLLGHSVESSLVSGSDGEARVWFKAGLGNAAKDLRKKLGIGDGGATPMSESPEPNKWKSYDLVINLDSKSASSLSKKIDKEGNSKSDGSSDKSTNKDKVSTGDTKKSN